MTRCLRDRALLLVHYGEGHATQRELRAARDQLAEQLYTPDPVKAESLTPLIQQISKLHGPLAQESLQIALEVRNVLTLQQLAKAKQRRQRLNELRTEMRKRLEEDR
ncbi:MAG: hypothetical protein KGL31_04525 [candidate division NC10 bacterium]|nr:hypothetical protein [candidate division NC10 bacterium]MDE2321167.1 hypothetical protein [candidate division NC10 bacterium]